jgi:hypothetical protein
MSSHCHFSHCHFRAVAQLFSKPFFGLFSDLALPAGWWARRGSDYGVFTISVSFPAVCKAAFSWKKTPLRSIGFAPHLW